PPPASAPVTMMSEVSLTVKFVLLVPVPRGVVTVIGPVVAPAGTVAASWVGETTVNALAAVPLKETCVAPLNPMPVIVTTVPTGPLPGEKLVIVGGTMVTVKLAALAALPSGVVTAIGPLVAPPGTVAVIWVGELTTKLLATPLKATADTPRKLVPVITT